MGEYLELSTTEELITELLKRTTFVGAIMVATNEVYHQSELPENMDFTLHIRGIQPEEAISIFADATIQIKEQMDAGEITYIPDQEEN